MNTTKKNKDVSDFLAAAIKPLARICLYRSVQFKVFITAVKKAFILAASEILKEEDKKANVSRISIMTGIHRMEVKKYVSTNYEEKPIVHPLTSLIGEWQTNKQFLTPSGYPRVLRTEGSDSEFSLLLKNTNKDLNPYSVLFELDRLKLIKRTKTTVSLEKGLYMPDSSYLSAIEFIAADLKDLSMCIYQNTTEKKAIKNLHLATEYDNISQESATQIQEWILKEGTFFHEKIRKYLSKYDIDMNPKLKDKKGGARIKVGSFSA